jgi:aspartate aminotransferase
MIVANSPHNPTGHVYDGSEWRALAALAVEHDLWLLSDEIYEKLVYEGTHLCPAAISPEVRAHTAVVNGVSKTFAMTGWRIGYLAAPEPLARLAARIQSQSTSCASSISQYAALAALELDRAAVEPMRAEFHRRRDLVLARARECPGLSVVPPAGAFYLWIDVSATGLRPSAFCDRLLEEEAVALVPGEAFGSDRHVRLSFAASGETLERAFERIRRFCERLGP